MTLRLITPPAVEPIELDAARLQCRVDGTDEDDMIRIYIKAARARVETHIRRRLITQTVEARFDRLAKFLPLQTGPIQSVTSVVYLDPDGAPQTLAPNLYRLTDGSCGAGVIPARLADWPSSLDDDLSVAVTFVAGYGLAADVPGDLISAVLITMQHLYEREAGDFPQAAIEMMQSHILWF
jgi:uncharacterized phiE125 gp8 family phage protein